MVECVFSPLQNMLVIDRIMLLNCIFSKLIDVFLKCWDQSSIENYGLNLIVKLLEVFVVELYILKRSIGAYKNSNVIVMLVFLHYRVNKP